MGSARNALNAATVAPSGLLSWMQTVSDQSDRAVSGEGPRVKEDFQAVGNSHHNSGGGNDDTTAIQNAINAAHSSGTGQVFFEPGSYRITSPLKMHTVAGTGANIALFGLGPRNASGTRGPTLVWDGPTDGTPRAMLDYDTTGSNVGHSPIEDLVISTRWIENAAAIRYRKKVDLGTYLRNVQFLRGRGDSVIYDLGSTNSYMYHCRWDACIGYAVRFKLGSTSIFGMEDCTYDNNNTAGLGDPLGFFYAERDGDNLNDVGYFYFKNMNLETQVDLAEVEAGGTDPADRRGLYQFLTHAAHTSTQYVVTFNNLKHDTAGGLASYSVFLMRGDGTAAQRGRRIIIAGHGLNGMGGTDSTAATGYKRVLGNVHANMKQSGNFGNYPIYQHLPQNSEIFASHRAQTWVYNGTD